MKSKSFNRKAKCQWLRGEKWLCYLVTHSCDTCIEDAFNDKLHHEMQQSKIYHCYHNTTLKDRASGGVFNRFLIQIKFIRPFKLCIGSKEFEN